MPVSNFNELPNTFGDLLDFVRAFGSMLGLLLGIFGIICLLGKNYIKMNGGKISYICGYSFDSMWSRLWSTLL